MMAINGHLCKDKGHIVDLPEGSIRLQEVTRLNWPAVGNGRKCHIVLTKFVDIQNTIQEQADPRLTLSHWKWDNNPSKPEYQQPVSSPPGYVYKGFSWLQRPKDVQVEKLPPSTVTGRVGDDIEAIYYITRTR